MAGGRAGRGRRDRGAGRRSHRLGRAGSAAPPPDATRLHGLTVPGLANAHSHAFQRALRGRAQRGGGSFWTWREDMYALAGRLDPDGYLRLARATFAEMALAGVTAVGEFHYVHHAPGRAPLRRSRTRWVTRVARAAAEAGIRITLIDACYLHGGIGEPPAGAQRRFCDADAAAWAERAGALADREDMRVAAAIHSVRAVDPESAEQVVAWAAARGTPLHAHVSEQPEEDRACLEAYGRRPLALLRDAGALELRLHGRPRHPLRRGRGRVARRGRRLVLPVPDDRARPGRRHRPGAGAGPRGGPPLPGQRLAGRDRPVRGGPRARARRATGARRARPSLDGRAAAGRERARARLPGLAGRRPDRAGRPGRSGDRGPGRRAAGGHRSRDGAGGASCSPPAPAT